MKPWSQLEPLLVCPFTREPLHMAGDVVATASGRTYPLVDGVPMLRPGPAAAVLDPNHVSNPVSPAFQHLMESAPGPVLFLGAGGSTFRADHVFEVEYNLFRHTDVLGDAHCLPFREGTFELVVALNVFEHLREPHVAAAELRRVLRPGGRVVVHTAFLQILHEEPHHYYGATEFGVRQWFRDFAAVEVNVSPNFNPFHGLSWTLHDLLYSVEVVLGPADREALGRLTLAELATGWRNPAFADHPAHRVLSRLPREVLTRFAAGFEVLATK